MKKNKILKEYLLTILGTVILTSGLYFFLIPENLSAGGVAGYAMIISNYIQLPISIISFIINVGLLIVGFIFLGKEFGGKTICSNLAFSAALYVMETFMPMSAPITNQTFFNMICGILVASFGVSIVFNQNASSGGTDIIASILKKYLNVNMGVGLFFANSLVIIGSVFTYDIQTSIFNTFSCLFTSSCVNYFMDGLNIKKEVVIISEKPEQIRQMIISKINRGLTIYKAQGGYTLTEKQIIVTILDNKEYIKLKKELRNVDPNVFVIVRRSNEVLGQGFNNF